MELIIAIILFVALVACWILLPGEAKSSKAHGAEKAPSASASRTV